MYGGTLFRISRNSEHVSRNAVPGYAEQRVCTPERYSGLCGTAFRST